MCHVLGIASPGALCLFIGLDRQFATVKHDDRLDLMLQQELYSTHTEGNVPAGDMLPQQEHWRLFGILQITMARNPQKLQRDTCAEANLFVGVPSQSSRLQV